MSKKVLHIIPYEKFTFDYIKRIEANFDVNLHTFLIYGNKPKSEIKDCKNFRCNVIFENKGSFINGCKIVRMFKKFDKIILHSLFLPPKWLLILSLVSKKISTKLFWNIWGADLYETYWTRNQNFFHKTRECIRKNLFKNLRAVGYIKSDYRYLGRWYDVYPKFYLASYAYDFSDIQLDQTQSIKTLNILVGNSATESCRHEEAFKLIYNQKLANYKVYCVLSYPNNTQYIEKIVSCGRQLFGDNFYPMIEFMEYSKYMQILNSIDIAIFNNNRQQALGNIASLIFYGKKVFVNNDNGCLEYFKDLGAIVFSTSEISSELQKGPLPDELKQNNKNAILSFFSNACFKKRWEKIFEDDFSFNKGKL